MTILDIIVGAVVGFTVTTAVGLGVLVGVGVWRNSREG